MRKVQATMLWLLALGVLLAAFATSTKWAVPEPAAFVDCRVNGPRVEVTLGAAPPSGYVAVLTPTRETLRLVDAEKSLDLLGQRYRRQPLILSVPNELGATRDGRQRRIFTVPGEYVIVFHEVENDEMESACRVHIDARR